MNNNQGQDQNSTKSLRGQVSDHDPGSNTSNLSATCDQYARKYESYSMMHSLHNPEQYFDHAIPTSHDNYVEVGTGIRIRKGQPRNRASPETLLIQQEESICKWITCKCANMPTALAMKTWKNLLFLRISMSQKSKLRNLFACVLAR